MIQIEHLTRRFHDLVAVDDVSLEVAEGEVFGFLGPNGAGKSTTIRILTGFLPATSGRAVVAGLEVAADSLGVRRHIGYLPEAVALPADARVDEYLEYRGRLKGLGATDRARRKETVLGQCGLVPMRRRILSQLSRGYRQRVGLADALLADPPVLILDEPTGGLDPAQRQDVLDLIADMAGQRTVLLSSHVLAEIEHVCSRVAIIRAGRLVAHGDREELQRGASNEGRILVGAEGHDAQVAAWLTTACITHERDRDGRCLLTPPASTGPAELLSRLVAAGLPIDRFEPQLGSLQQIFLELTRS